MPAPPAASQPEWFAASTFDEAQVDVAGLAETKQSAGAGVSVCLPTLNEAATIGKICGVIRSELVETTSLVDEIVVVDSGSTDETIALAREEGALVHVMDELLPHLHHPHARGKGEAIWKSLAAVRGDIVVWLDADVRNFDAQFVARLVAPILDGDYIFTKAFYKRPLGELDDRTEELGGGRVTELLARPLLSTLAPELSGFIQPLAGECAVRRDVALELPIATGYGVDIALLFDIVQRAGLERTAQVNLGTRIHRNRDLSQLGRMSFEVLAALLRRLEAAGRIKLAEDPRAELVQFVQDEPRLWSVPGFDRPPMTGVV